MVGVGAAEAVIIVLIVLVLFAPTVIAFFVGYTLGQRKGGESAEKAPPASAEARTPLEPHAAAGPLTPEPSTPEPPAVEPPASEPQAAGRTQAPADNGDADV